jgi:WD40 repeat protein/tetratricopeptide (TPR) repeat protein
MNPFPGLRPFTQEEDYLFFGREEQTLELLRRLGSHRFVAVVGTSGSGKSSLVRCGLLSELLGGKMLEAGASWEIAVTHPGGNPLALLTNALLEADLYDREEEHARENLLATLSRSHFGLVETVKQAGLGEGTNFLLVVDQFEEIFRFHEAGQTQQEAANEFVSLLLEAAVQKQVPIYIVLTMRSDFIGECGQFEGLAEMVNRGEFLIPRLSREQYKRVIEGPIKVAGGRIAPRLLQRLLNDLGQQADQLPCLQHALMRTWNVWAANGDSAALDLDDYHRVGKMSQALSLHADEVYESLDGDRPRALCRGIFQALTVEEANNRGIRRPQRLGRLGQILEAPPGELLPIIDAFRQKGVTFLMPSPEVELTEATIIDISHESLMRVWIRLRQWVEEETQAAGIYHRLSESADLHERGKAGLYRDPELGIALAWRESKRPNAAWAERYRPRFATAMAFLEASRQASVAEDQAREAARQRELEQAQRLAEARQLRLEQQQRAARKLRKLIASVAVVAVIAAIACVAALVARHEAGQLARIADAEAENARESAQQARQSQQETAEALIQVGSSLTKAEMAEEAGRKLLYTTDMQLAPFVWRDDRSTARHLRTLLAKHDLDDRITGNNDEIPADKKPDLRGFEWHYYQHLLNSSAEVLSGHETSVAAGAFSSDGQLVTLDQNGQVRRWNLDSHDEDRASRRELPMTRNAQFRVLSPDGRLAALAEGNKVYVFDTSTGKENFRIDSANVQSRRLIFTFDGEGLVIVDDKIRSCAATGGEVVASLNLGLNRGSSLALSADGLTLAVVGHGPLGNQFSIFRLDAAARTVTPLVKNVGPTSTLGAAGLSPDGRLLAVGAKLYGAVFVFDTATGRTIARHGAAHASDVSALSFSGDGAKLVTADVEGTIKIWDDVRKLTSKSAASSTLKGHEAAITQVGFSSTGKQLVSTGADGTARVWDMEQSGAAIRALERSGSPCYVVRFSPDGQWIAAADGDRVRLWDAAAGNLVRELSTADKGRVFSVAFSPTDDRLLAVGYGGQADVSYVLLWDIDAGRELARLPGATDLADFRLDESTGVVGALAFSPDGKYLVAGFGTPRMFTPESLPSPLKVWEVATRRLIRRLSGHTGFCVSLEFSSDGARLASGSRDGTAILWSTASWTATQTLKNPDKSSAFSQAESSMVDDVSFSPDGKTLAMASRGGIVQLWDVAGGKLLASLKGHSNAVSAVAFSPDGRTLASGGADKTVRLWNVETRRELMQLDPGRVDLGDEEGGVESLAFSSDGIHLLVGGYGGAAFWSAAPIVWNDPERAAKRLQFLRQTNADFQSRIRMLSENLPLHEALEKLDLNDVQVQAALAATRANWHAAHRRWAEAAGQYDRLQELTSNEPQAWLRTPGLIRVATALFQEGRPALAATLLTGGAKRRSQDGLLSAAETDPANPELWRPLLAAIEARLINDPDDAGLLELRAELAGQWSGFEEQAANYTAAIAALERKKPERTADLQRLYRRRGNAHLDLKQWQKAHDDYERGMAGETTDEDLLANLALARANVLLDDVDSPLTKITDHWVKLAAAYRIRNDQRAIDRLVERRPELAGPIGDLFFQDQENDWPRAVEIYSRGITAETTEVGLLSKRARAHAALKNWDAAAADWSRAARGNPDGAKLLAEFAQRLAAVGQVSLANGPWKEAQALYERSLDADPANDVLATELAQLFHDAARAAALAAAGKGADPPQLDDRTKANFRRQALDWLNAALTASTRSGAPNARLAAAKTLIHLQHDSDVAGIRDQAALTELPEKEQKAFTRFWADLAKSAEPANNAERLAFALVHNNLGMAAARKGQIDEAIACYQKAIELEAEFAPAYLSLGAILCDVKRDYDGAIASFRKAIELSPMFAAAHTNLGIALMGKGQSDEAEASLRKAIELNPMFAAAHFTLGNALAAQGQSDEAIACYQKAVELDPTIATSHYILGNALARNGQSDEAIACYQKAIELDAEFAEAHCNLGHALRNRGRFAESLAALQRGHELGIQRPGWPYPSAAWVNDVQSLAELEGKLPAFLKGDFQPGNNSELLGLARICLAKKLSHTATGLYAAALAVDPQLAADLGAGHRYNAACNAALAAVGLGEDAAELDDQARTRLRQQALDWLRADLADLVKLLDSGPPQARRFVVQTLIHWQNDTDLAGLRDAEALAKLLDEERVAWETLWADVSALLKGA